MPTTDQAEAADPTLLFDTDPLQPGEVRLHSWMLYTSQAHVLDLTGEHIKTKGDIEATFHTLHLCPEEKEYWKSDGRKGKNNHQVKVSPLQIVILLMIKKSTLDLKLQYKKDNIIPYQDQL